MNTIVLRELLLDVNNSAVDEFISNKLDNGDFPAGQTLYNATIDERTAGAWIHEYSRYLSDICDDKAAAVFEDEAFQNETDDATIIRGIDKHPADKVKEQLIDYFQESAHQEWEGWKPTEVLAIRKFYKDFLLGLDNS